MNKTVGLVSVVAWVCFVVSFFLPATDTLEVAGTAPGTPLTGWQAMIISVQSLGNPWLIVFRPQILPLFLLWVMGNAGMLVAPIVIFTLRSKALIFVALLVPTACSVWFLPSDMSGNLFSGFYVWETSLVLMSLACILNALETTNEVDLLIDDAKKTGCGEEKHCHGEICELR